MIRVSVFVMYVKVHSHTCRYQSVLDDLALIPRVNLKLLLERLTLPSRGGIFFQSQVNETPRSTGRVAAQLLRDLPYYKEIVNIILPEGMQEFIVRMLHKPNARRFAIAW